jgi:hypothetical protein
VFSQPIEDKKGVGVGCRRLGESSLKGPKESVLWDLGNNTL